jgi:hypothetical protein
LRTRDSSSCAANQSVDIADLACGVLAKRHGPLPDAAKRLACLSGTPSFLKKEATERPRLRCGAVRLSAAPAFIESFHLLLASEDSALRRVRLLWPLLTSLLLSRRIAPTVVRCVRTRAEIRNGRAVSSGKTCLLLSDPADLPPSVPDNYWASPSLAWLPTLKRPDIHFLCVASEISSSAFFRPRPRGRSPCLDGWFRSSRSMGDLHPLNANHTEHTRLKPVLPFPVPAVALHKEN